MDLKQALLKLEERYGPHSIVRETIDNQDHQFILADMIEHLTERQWVEPTEWAIQFKPSGAACLYEFDADEILKNEPTYRVYPSVRYFVERN